MISFAGGYPSPTLLDGAGIEQAAQRVFAQGAGILQYGATEGAPALREALARLCGARGIEAKPEDILVTTGSQQAFDLLVRVFVEPGDVVYVESPSYPATLQALRLAGARIEQVPVDAQGMRIDALETLLANAPADALPNSSTPSRPTPTPAARCCPRNGARSWRAWRRGTAWSWSRTIPTASCASRPRRSSRSTRWARGCRRPIR